MLRNLFIILMLFPGQQSNKRILTVYAKSTINAYYKQQMQYLKDDKPGLEDRDLVIETHIYNSDNASAFKKAHIKGDFTVVLTGKDGGEKYRSEQPLTLQKLYAIIDGMPMRKAEMGKN